MFYSTEEKDKGDFVKAHRSLLRLGTLPALLPAPAGAEMNFPSRSETLLIFSSAEK